MGLKKYPEDIYKLPSRSFEELIATLLEEQGWEVNLTGQTRDGGRDVLAYLNTDIGKLLCLVETKRYKPSNPVGVGLVRTLYGTVEHEQANVGLLVTSSRFTKDALDFGNRPNKY